MALFSSALYAQFSRFEKESIPKHKMATPFCALGNVPHLLEGSTD
ncbi:hypothetical protein APA_785 [Pseudanabaena sp. lw0831]|nr:hypothetical protein APA_785 [Pseudanabaena sp. lw0831]